MCNIKVGRYDHPESVGYAGWLEPEDRLSEIRGGCSQNPWVVACLSE